VRHGVGGQQWQGKQDRERDRFRAVQKQQYAADRHAGSRKRNIITIK
jgi:hypothetical protein